MYHHVIITCPDYQQNCQQRAIHLPSTTGAEHPLCTTEAGHLPIDLDIYHLPLELVIYHLPLELRRDDKT